MDALPITEETGLPFASLVRDTWDGAEVGVMHACGHDVHTAIGLGVATVLAAPDVRSRLAGDVLFLFQPAEEGVKGTGIHGAERMLAEGAFEPRLPDAAFGLHVNPKIGLGHVSLHRGGAMAAVDRFSITIQVSAPAAVATKVLIMARPATPSASSSDPALKPNQPTHSKPVPIMVITRLCGGMGSAG